MYFGETQILENRINDFVSVAKDLKIKEISEEKDETEDDVQDPTMNATNTHLRESIDEINVKAETKVTSSDWSVAKHRQRLIAKNDRNFSCDECDAIFSKTGNLNRHVQSKHAGLRYPCTKCDYQATTQQHLDNHTNSKHIGVKYPCTKCDYKATQKSSLKKHYDSIHAGIRSMSAL